MSDIQPISNNQRSTAVQADSKGSYDSSRSQAGIGNVTAMAKRPRPPIISISDSSLDPVTPTVVDLPTTFQANHSAISSTSQLAQDTQELDSSMVEWAFADISNHDDSVVTAASYSADSETETDDSCHCNEDGSPAVMRFTFTTPPTPTSPPNDPTTKLENNSHQNNVNGSGGDSVHTAIPKRMFSSNGNSDGQNRKNGSGKRTVGQKTSLPAVVIHTDCESSPTYFSNNNSIKKRPTKKKKKDGSNTQVGAARSKSFHFPSMSSKRKGAAIPTLKLPLASEEGGTR